MIHYIIAQRYPFTLVQRYNHIRRLYLRKRCYEFIRIFKIYNVKASFFCSFKNKDIRFTEIDSYFCWIQECRHNCDSTSRCMQHWGLDAIYPRIFQFPASVIPLFYSLEIKACNSNMSIRTEFDYFPWTYQYINKEARHIF